MYKIVYYFPNKYDQKGEHTKVAVRDTLSAVNEKQLSLPALKNPYLQGHSFVPHAFEIYHSVINHIVANCIYLSCCKHQYTIIYSHISMLNTK